MAYYSTISFKYRTITIGGRSSSSFKCCADGHNTSPACLGHTRRLKQAAIQLGYDAGDCTIGISKNPCLPVWENIDEVKLPLAGAAKEKKNGSWKGKKDPQIPSNWVSMTAKKEGVCKGCGKPIVIGQPILWCRGVGAVCSAPCVDKVNEKSNYQKYIDEQPPKPEPKPEPPKPSSSTKIAGLFDVEALAEAILPYVLPYIESKLALKPEVDLEELVEQVKLKLDAPNRIELQFPTGELKPVEGIVHPKFELLCRLIAGGCTRIWLTGEAGDGKTFAVKQAAELLETALYMVTPVSDQYQLMGYKDAAGNYQPTEVYRWVKHPGKAILLLDEVDACHPNALIAINAVLANGSAVFPDGRVEIGPEKVVVATANTTGSGATLKYNARLAQDGAFIDRFAHWLHWGHDDATEKAIAMAYHRGSEDAVRISFEIRNAIEANGIELAWGPRRTYALCDAIAAGVSPREAADLSGLSKLDENQAKRVRSDVNWTVCR